MCNQMKRLVKFNFVLLSFFLLAGCGNDTMVDPGESVEITGVVTLDGKPLKEAEVTFMSADGDQLVAPALVMTDGKGNYIVSVNSPREYKVTVDRMMNGGPHPALKAYQGEETSLKANVTKENKKFDFVLKKSN